MTKIYPRRVPQTSIIAEHNDSTSNDIVSSSGVANDMNAIYEYIGNESDVQILVRHFVA